jgi:hypothetical protein
MGTEPDDTQRDRAADEEEGASADAVDARAEKADARGKPRRDEFWLRLGFESFEEYLAGLEREQSRWQRGRIPDVGTPSLAEVSREALESELTRRRGYRQVGIKLRPDDYEALRRAARAHGDSALDPGSCAHREGGEGALEGRGSHRGRAGGAP